MGIFKKKGPDVIDLTDLQKRGILKSHTQQKKDFVDAAPQISSSPIATTSELSFLDNLASASSATQTSGGASNAELRHIQVKIEDFEYKLDRFLERIEKIEAKLNEQN